jgi:tRNA (adenine57-N1/adenine58-N1)-methyltransferase
MIQRILIHKAKKTYLEDQDKTVTVSPQKLYYIEDISKDFHCTEGVIKKEDLQKKNEIIKSAKGKEFFIIEASFIDSYKGIKKTAQTIPLKDLGFIIAEIGLNKDMVVVDTGSGSGGSACFLAQFAKKVYTFDINEHNLAQTQRNIDYFGLKNVVVKNADAYVDIPVKETDVIILDLPEPWRAIEPSDKILHHGGFIIIYCPQITQAQQFLNELMKKNYLHIKTVEIVERDWKVEGQIVRPVSLSNIHSGFITVVRKI